MDVKLKLLVVMPAMGRGGAERVVTHIMNHVDRSRFDVSLLLLRKKGDLLAELSSDVAVYSFGSGNKLKSFFSLYHKIKQLSPDIVFSSLSLNLWIALLIPLLPKNIRFIARESNIPSEKIKKYKFPLLTKYLYRFYRRFDVLVSQSQEMSQDFKALYPEISGKLATVGNPLDFNLIKEKLTVCAGDKPAPVELLVVGRISSAKRFDLAVEILAKLPASFQLTIVGRDMLSGEIHNLVENLQVSDRVTFVGETDNPYIYMKRADVLLMTSDYEGFPNVTIEAIACGLPVLALDHVPAIKEIITPGVNGFLCSSSPDMLAFLTNSFGKLAALDGRIMKDDIIERYEVSRIVEKYMVMFDVSLEN